MNRLLKTLTAALLALAGTASCTETPSQQPAAEDFKIDIEVSDVTATSAVVTFTPSDDAEEYLVYLVKKSEYRPSNIPGDAKYATGVHTETYSSLETGTLYLAVAVAELKGYTATEEFSSAGTVDPSEHPSDFIVKEFAMKQKRSGKRGVGGGFQLAEDISLLSKGVAWDYDWSHNYPYYIADFKANDMMFLPMVWNAGINKDNIRRFVQDYPSAKYLLAYNEPNLTDQANMTPAQAAASWGELKEFAREVGLQIISPALNYGTLAGYNDPVKWLDEFLACDGVNLDDIAGIALHCYMPNVQGMREMIHRFEKYGKPIFMTEFCHANGNITNDVATQANFMSEAVNYLETDPMVGGYAWFIARASGSWSAISLLSTDSQKRDLTDLGRLYVNMSSFDKTYWYKRGEAIPAEHYCANNMSEDDKLPAVFPVRACTDSYGDLMILGNQTGAWVEYQIEADKDGDYALGIRYAASLMDGVFDLAVDGWSLGDITLPKNGEWSTAWFDLPLTAGKHTLRLTGKSGRADINWFYID